MVVANKLSERILNRALLARQHLLRRVQQPACAEIEHLAGMQTQVPDAPYVGLWTRLDGFAQAELVQLLLHRRVVRVPMMRATLHLMTVEDALRFRPVVQQVLERSFESASPFGRRVRHVDRPALLAAARRLIEVQPRTRAELMRLLGDSWPDRDRSALAYAVTYLLPVAQVPPRGIWGKTAQARWAPLEDWMGAKRVAQMVERQAVEQLVLRYLGAFGPASAADFRAWSGLSGAAGLLDGLRDHLRTFRDEIRGTELFDLPDTPLASADTPAPPRFLPEFDNLLVAYANRARIVAAEHRPWLNTNLGRPMLLVDGFVQGAWRVQRNSDETRLRIDTFSPLSSADAAAVIDEGVQLLRFLTGESTADQIEFGLL